MWTPAYRGLIWNFPLQWYKGNFHSVETRLKFWSLPGLVRNRMSLSCKGQKRQWTANPMWLGGKWLLLCRAQCCSGMLFEGEVQMHFDITFCVIQEHLQSNQLKRKLSGSVDNCYFPFFLWKALSWSPVIYAELLFSEPNSYYHLPYSSCDYTKILRVRACWPFLVKSRSLDS